MRIMSDLGFFAIGAFGLGWMGAQASYWGALVFALLAAAAMADFNRNYQMDLAAARRWREQRWKELKALEAQYKESILADMPPTVSEYNQRVGAAERRAAQEIEERFGPDK